MPKFKRSLLTVNGADKVVLYKVPFRSPEGMETRVDDAVPPYRLIPGAPRPSVGSIQSLSQIMVWVYRAVDLGPALQ